MNTRPVLVTMLIGAIAAGAAPSPAAAEGCEALNGKWVGSQNLLGQRDAIPASYTVTARGSEVSVSTGKAEGTGTCKAGSDGYVMKLKWGELSSEMTFRVVGDDVAMFFWQDSAGEGGRGSLTRASQGESTTP